MTPALSVVVPTIDGRVSLVRTLESLIHQANSSELEVVVVLNGGEAAGAGFPHRFPSIRFVHEPRLGLSNARNRGVVETKASLVAFVDDDATVGAEWSEAVINAFEDFPVASAVGGKVVLDWPNGRPPWLPRLLESPYSALDLGDKRRWLEFPRSPFGVNFAVRREVFGRLGFFSPHLGRVGKSLRSSEEVEFINRMQAAGSRVLYEPEAIVTHHVQTGRDTRSWLLRRCFVQGMSEAAMFGLQRHPSTGQWAAAGIRAAGSAMFRNKIALAKNLRDRNQRRQAVDIEAARVANRLGFAASTIGLGAKSLWDA